jgi:ADP-ribosylglycohydrolase
MPADYTQPSCASRSSRLPAADDPRLRSRPGGTAAGAFGRVLGGLYGAVCGDALGAVTEMLSRNQIVATYGRLEQMLPPDLSPFAAGRGAGQVTDDASQLIALARVIARTDRLAPADVVAALLEWASDDEMLQRFAGPTTRAAIAQLQDGADPIEVGRDATGFMRGTSDGAAMKVAPVGWAHPGDLPAAARDAVTVCLPTHATVTAIAGACAIACGAARAMTVDADAMSVVEACLWGATQGERLGLEHGRDVAGPSVSERIQLGLTLATSDGDPWAAVDRIARTLGSGLHSAEAVPAAVAAFAAAGGRPREAIILAANLGDDTDTVACMAGALAGTLGGIDAIPDEWRTLVTEANGLELEPLAAELVARHA